MKNQRFLLIFAGLGLMLVAAFSLTRLRDHQRLGAPGVRVGHSPIYDPRGKVLSETSVVLPDSVGELKSIFAPITDFEASSLPKDTTFGRRVYEAPDKSFVQVSVILMGVDRTSIHRPEVCLPGQGWQILKSESDILHLSNPRKWELPVQKLTLDITATTTNGAPIQLGGVYVYWFVADGLVTSSHSTRMLWMARDLLLKQTLDRWACVGFFAPCAPGRQAETYEFLKKMIAELVPQFQTTFPLSPVASRSCSLGCLPPP